MRPETSRRAELFGLADQALVSGVNFLTIVLVARALSPADFGRFVLVFTALQTCGMLQNALLSRPHNVLAAVRRGRDYADYSTTTALAQVGLAAALALVAAIAAGVVYAIGLPDVRLLLACIPAVVAWQLQELGRRMLYTERRLGAAFASDLVAYGGQGLALVLLVQAGALTGTRVVLTMAAAFALGGVVVGWLLRTTLSGSPSRALLRETWRFGRWLGAGELGQWLSTHFTIYLAALVIGPVASAALRGRPSEARSERSRRRFR